MGELMTSLMNATVTDVITTIDQYVRIGVNIFLGFCGLLVVFFCIWVGFRMAKAESDDKRKEAKSHLIYAIIGLVAIIIVNLVIGLVIPNLALGGNNPGGVPGIGDVYTQISAAMSAVLNMIVAIGTAFAVWVGWQLMKADSDDKRKQAKMQLIYTGIALIAIVILNIVANAIFQNLAV